MNRVFAIMVLMFSAVAGAENLNSPKTCDLSTPVESSSSHYQNITFYGNAFYIRSDAEGSAKAQAMQDCRVTFNNNPTCAIEYSDTRLSDSGESYITRVIYSVVAPKRYSPKELQTIRCEKAYACLETSPSAEVVKLLEKVIRKNCK